MKFKKIEVENYPTLKIGDQFEIDEKTYQVIGYTDAGTKLLVKILGEYEVFKFVKKTRRDNQ